MTLNNFEHFHVVSIPDYPHNVLYHRQYRIEHVGVLTDLVQAHRFIHTTP